MNNPHTSSAGLNWVPFQRGWREEARELTIMNGELSASVGLEEHVVARGDEVRELMAMADLYVHMLDRAASYGIDHSSALLPRPRSNTISVYDVSRGTWAPPVGFEAYCSACLVKGIRTPRPAVGENGPDHTAAMKM